MIIWLIIVYVLLVYPSSLVIKRFGFAVNTYVGWSLAAVFLAWFLVLLLTQSGWLVSTGLWIIPPVVAVIIFGAYAVAGLLSTEQQIEQRFRQRREDLDAARQRLQVANAYVQEWALIKSYLSHEQHLEYLSDRERLEEAGIPNQVKQAGVVGLYVPPEHAEAAADRLGIHYDLVTDDDTRDRGQS